MGQLGEHSHSVMESQNGLCWKGPPGFPEKASGVTAWVKGGREERDKKWGERWGRRGDEGWVRLG